VVETPRAVLDERRMLAEAEEARREIRRGIRDLQRKVIGRIADGLTASARSFGVNWAPVVLYAESWDAKQAS
jgi:hypothetical protein